jgi:hypothetical protein
LKRKSNSRIGSEIDSKKRIRFFPQFLTIAAIAALAFLLITRIFSEIQNYFSQSILLRVEAKCPGLPYGQNSGGVDYINVALDVALVAVAGYLAYITARDVRRKKGKKTQLDKEEK